MENNNDNEISQIQGRIFETVLKFEKPLQWKNHGDLSEKADHVLSQYKSIADNAISECKRFMEDCKTQYKALEMITEGLTSEGLNHTHKRVIANHLISMLRNMVDRINRYEYEYSIARFDRYDFFRSEAPERKVYEERRELKFKTEQQDKILQTLKEVHPDIFKSLTEADQIPF
jgi:hypothetical protein